MDDATSEIYYVQLVAEESTRTVMAGLREVIEQQGVFCALYSDRASHFFLTPKADQPVDHTRLTQVGRALRELGVQMIPANSPQARSRSERGFGTWQGRLPLTQLDPTVKYSILNERFDRIKAPGSVGLKPTHVYYRDGFIQHGLFKISVGGLGGGTELGHG
ncbi:MAG: hypothetical protein LC776_09315 [Acidobacteria bacterium]|nr:hypothetical protein [Acidobacteriota bacterium]